MALKQKLLATFLFVVWKKMKRGMFSTLEIVRAYNNMKSNLAICSSGKNSESKTNASFSHSYDCGTYQGRGSGGILFGENCPTHIWQFNPNVSCSQSYDCATYHGRGSGGILVYCPNEYMKLSDNCRST